MMECISKYNKKNNKYSSESYRSKRDDKPFFTFMIQINVIKIYA